MDPKHYLKSLLCQERQRTKVGQHLEVSTAANGLHGLCVFNTGHPLFRQGGQAKYL